ncbi:hypothetical protein TNCV_4376481 [Trichonephila clavipes]|nr:hypothetical protein TNCV_4376481 [Trichonephila clavipes]
MSKVWKRTPHPSMPDKGATGKLLLHKLPRPATPNAPSSLRQKRARPLPRIKLSKATFVWKVSLSLTLLAEPHPLHPPVHKLTEKTNENSNNKVSHGIQAIENENSDLAQVIELVSMISNIIKRSPEILQLLPKLKNSEDDKAKALLLFEAMLDKF